MYLLRSEDAGGPYCYVGESLDVRRRWTHYRSPGPSQLTNRRINSLLMLEIGAHGPARLRLAAICRLRVDGLSTTADLGRQSVRRLFEHAWQVALATGGERLINLGDRPSSPPVSS